MYSSSTVFDSCINTITSYFSSCISLCWLTSFSFKSSFNNKRAVFHGDPLEFPVAYLENIKRFPGGPIGIPGDVRSAPDDVTWSEICGDDKRFNKVESYCDNGNIVDGDGRQGRCSYSKRIYSYYILLNLIMILKYN